MKLYKRLAVILAGSAMTVGFSSTWAYYSDSQSIVNPFHTGESSVELVEEFNPSDTILPGETVDKKPHFVNTGNIDLVLRLTMDTYWADKKTGVETSDLDTEMVTMNHPADFNENWVEIPKGSGIYYYTHILAGEGKEGSTTPYFLESLTLSPKASNDAHADDYSKGEFIVDFNAEAVSADEASLAVSGWELTPLTPGAGQLDWNDLLPIS